MLLDGSRHRRPIGGLTKAQFIVALCTVFLFLVPVLSLIIDKVDVFGVVVALSQLSGG